MNSQKYNKEELYPSNYTEDDKMEFDIYLEQSKQYFPKMANEEWLLKLAIKAFMEKQKRGEDKPLSPDEIADIKNQYSKDTVYYTEPIEVSE